MFIAAVRAAGRRGNHEGPSDQGHRLFSRDLVSIVMEGFQWWQKPSANTAANSSNQIGFATTFVLFLLIAVPCFVFVFGTFEARPTFLLSKEGMKSAGTKFLRMLCMLGGFGVAALAWALAIRLLGTHP